MTKAKKSTLFLAFFSFVYLTLSFILYQNVSHINPHRDIDSPGYERLAQHFAKTNTLRPNVQTVPPLVQQPIGYPLFMGVIYKIFGTSDGPLIWLQILLTLLSGFLLFFAALHLFGSTIAHITFALFSINIGYIVLAQFILAESLLLFFLVLFFERFFYFLHTNHRNALIIAGLALGASTWVKPAALYYYIPFLLIFVAFTLIKANTKLRLPIVFALAFFAPIHLYQLYNYTTYGVASFGQLGNFNLCVWFWSKVETDQHTFSSSTERNKVFGQEQQKKIKLIKGNPLSSESWVPLKKAFFTRVSKDPWLFIKTWTKETCKTFLGLFSSNLKLLTNPKIRGGDVSFFFTEGPISQRVWRYITLGSPNTTITAIAFFEFFFNIIKYLLALIALFWLLVRRRWFLMLFFSSYIAYFSLVTGFDGCARYRTMFEFIILLLTAIGLYMCLLLFKKKYNKKTLLGFSIFTFVFTSFALAIKGKWFGVDDLGVILNGLVKKFSDIGRIFTDDSRNYASTYNYNLPKSNVISGFLRPLQQLFFSLIYYLFGANVFAFQLLHVFFHAANALLLYLFFTFWLPISLATFGSFLFAFYPNMSWLSWLCTLQHSLSLFFLLGALFFYIPLLRQRTGPRLYTHPFFYLSGISFLCSLFSRETHIFLAPWALLGVLLFFTPQHSSLFSRIKIGFYKTSLFFAGTIIYVSMRLYAFGFASLIRTANNVLIRFPFLKKFFLEAQPIQHVAANTTTITKNIATKAISPPTISFFEKITHKLSSAADKLFTWLHTIFNAPHTLFSQKLLLVFAVLFLIALLVIAYKKHKPVALFLLSGIPLFMWPCVLVYPSPRYMNTAYPLLILIVLLGFHFLLQKKLSRLSKTLFTCMFLFFTGNALICGFTQNIYLQINNSKNRHSHQTYIDFFKNNHIPKNAHLIFISTRNESDLEQILQVVSKDFSLRVAHIVISKLACKGQYNFQEDYRVTGVSSSITPIQGGYRFTSHNKEHCGWTFHSYQPVVWSEYERSYILAPKFYTENNWYHFSMGKFFIHEITNKKYVTDVSFVFDKKWIIPNTFFVAWDTIEGKYKTIDSSHIVQKKRPKREAKP